MIDITTYTYLSCLAVSFICSIVQFGNHPLHLKIISVLLFLTIINEGVAFWGNSFFGLSDNIKVYNIFIPVAFALFCSYFVLVIRFKWFKPLVKSLLAFFLVLWYITTFQIFEFSHWNSYLNVIETVFIIFMVTVYYYQLFILSPLINLQKHSEFWIATALIIYYPCTLPFTGLLNYFLSNYEIYGTLSTHLLSVFQIFNIILYSLFAYAFLCRINTRKSLLLRLLAR